MLRSILLLITVVAIAVGRSHPSPPDHPVRLHKPALLGLGNGWSVFLDRGTSVVVVSSRADGAHDQTWKVNRVVVIDGEHKGERGTILDDFRVVK